MSNPTFSVVGSTDTASPDPFDLKALQLTQDFIGTVGVKKQLLTIPVRKPNPQDSFVSTRTSNIARTC